MEFPSSEEIHSFVIGFTETACPWRARVRIDPSRHEYLQPEYHYYSGGRCVGFAVLAGLSFLAVKGLM